MQSRQADVKSNPISVNQAVKFAWSAFKRRYGLFVAILLTTFGAWVALEVVVIAGKQLGIWLWVAAHLAFLVFFAEIEAGLLKAVLALYDGEEPTFADTFTHFALGLRLLVGQILYLLMVAVGLMLFIIPGVYLGVRYALFGFCLVTDEVNLRGSWQQSAILSSGTKMTLLAILVSLLAFNVLGAIFLGIGLFVTAPLSILVMTAVYRQLRRTEQVARIAR